MDNRIREFDVFLRVAAEASFSAVARSLDCNPSTISKLIQRLENRLGVRLFNRNSRALALTLDGERFLDAAQRVADAVENAENVVAPGMAEMSGVLRINSSLAFAEYHIVPHMREFLDHHPKLRFEFMLTATPVDMFEHQIDVSLRGGYIPDSSLIAKRIASSRWIVCASPAYLERNGIPNIPDDLSKHNCLNFLAGSYRSTWPMCEGNVEESLQLKGNVSSNSPDLLHALALDGVGIARLSQFHVGHDLASGRLVALLENFQSPNVEPVYAVYPSKRNLSTRVKIFMQFLEKKLNGSRLA